MAIPPSKNFSVIQGDKRPSVPAPHANPPPPPFRGQQRFSLENWTSNEVSIIVTVVYCPLYTANPPSNLSRNLRET